MATVLFVLVLIALLGLRVWAGLQFSDWLQENPTYANKLRHQYY